MCRTILGLCIACAVAGPLDAQSQVRGVVVHAVTGEPIEGVTVRWEVRRVTTVTASDGRFALTDVPNGDVEIRFSRIGFEPAVVTVSLSGSDTVDLTVSMTPAVTRLRDIVVTPGRFGVLDAPVASHQTLSREEIETIPQLGEDVFRTIKRLPGFAAEDISARVSVRGGTDREMLVMLDGVELYEPYHLKDFDGALGIVDIYSVGGIDLATGGFGVEYGDHTTGIIAMSSRVPPTTGTRTTLGLSITNASFMNQGAFGDGRGQWLVSGRRGYLDIALALTGGNDDISPIYWDTFGKFQYQLADRHRVSINTLHAYDDLNFADFEEDGYITTNWGSNYGWITWGAQWSDDVTTQLTTSAGRVFSERGGWFEELGRSRGPEQAFVFDDRSFAFGGARLDLTWSLGDHAVIKVGGEAKRLRADYRYDARTRTVTSTDELLVADFDTLLVDTQPSGNELGTYAALRIQPFRPLTAEVGVRYDRYTHSDDEDVSPRVQASYQLADRTTFRGSWGWYAQSHGIHQLDVGDGETTFHPSDRADQLAVGLEHRAGAVTVRLEAYRRHYEDQRPRYLSLDREIEPFLEVEGDRLRFDPEEGDARGIEFLLQYEAGSRWAWSASYALSEARDRFEGRWVPRTFDQRHALSVSVSHRPNARWDLTGSFHFNSGWPITGALYAADTLADGSVHLVRHFEPVNEMRLPAYHRLDLRVNRAFPLGRGLLQVYLDLFNVYNRTNLRSYFYYGIYDNGQLIQGQDEGETLLPLLPSLGLRWEF